MQRIRRVVMASSLLVACGSAAAQVELVRDINAGGSSRAAEDLFIASEEWLLFSANDGSTGPALWRSDGTPAGTVLVRDIFGETGTFAVPSTARGVGGLGWFIVNDGFVGPQPWRSDGTSGGTMRVTTPLAPADTIETNSGFGRLFDTVAFAYASRLWRSDGTMAAESPGAIETSSLPIANVDDRLYLYGKPAAASDYGLVRTDGTLAGTALVEAQVTPFTPVAVNGRLYFTQNTPTTGTELFVLDAGAASTRLVRDIVTGFGSSSPERLTRVDDRLFFTATDPDAGRELWVTDGTEAGTQRVEDIVPGANGSNPTALTASDGQLYFAATTPANGTELWVSDGSEGGTLLAVDLNPGTGSGLTAAGVFGRDDAIAAVNRRIFFQGRPDNFGFGARLRLLDTGGTSATALDESTFALGPMLPLNGRLLFSGQRNSGGMELYGADLLGVVGTTWCAKPEEGIPDAGTAVSTIRLPDAGSVYALRVRVDIGHTNVGDLEVYLEHRETARDQTLVARPGTGACAGDLMDVELADDGATSVDTSCAPAEARLAYPRDATYAPSGALNVFDGDTLGGHWDLYVTDAASTNVGTLHEWCITWSGPGLFADGFEEM